MKTSNLLRLRPMRSCYLGFTLIELLLVIAILSILAAMLLPLMAESLRLARLAACRSHMRQVGIFLQLYVGDSHTWYPPRSWGHCCWSGDSQPGYANSDARAFVEYLSPAYSREPLVFYCPANVWERPFRGSQCPAKYPWPWSWPSAFWPARINYDYYCNPYNRSQAWNNPWTGWMKSWPPTVSSATRAPSAIIYYETAAGGAGSALMAPHPRKGQASVANYPPANGHDINVLCFDASARMVYVPCAYGASTTSYWQWEEAQKK